MSIRIMKTDNSAVDTAINMSCEMIYNIEDLLKRGPKQLEAYTSTLKILKDMKRGCPVKESINRNAVQGCPPSMIPNENCEFTTCQSCWENYVKTYLRKAREK